MTRYFTEVANDLLDELRNGVRLPSSLRLLRVVTEPSGLGVTLVEFEDDDAPAEMAGKKVSFAITADYNVWGQVTRAWVSDRHVVREHYGQMS